MVARVAHYRLVSLVLVVVGATLLFLGFFFVWVIAPVVAVAVFYLVFFFNEERGGVGRGRWQRRRLRRQLLVHEAKARRADLMKTDDA
jgi:fatty acid desaturase